MILREGYSCVGKLYIFIIEDKLRVNEKLARSKNASSSRIMSRSQAKKTFAGQDIKATLGRQGIKVRATHPAMLAEEAPQVYKPSNEVVDVVHNLGIATRVAKLVPLGVSKG